LEGEAMGIWLELGIFGLVFVFAFWQMHDVRKAQEQTRQQRAREKAAQEAQEMQETDASKADKAHEKD
jgi:ABC-type nickel/cobalt efflux system permease component RcnA